MEDGPNTLWADYGSCSMYSMVLPLHPGHPIVGIPPIYSPRNLAASTATSPMASLTNISSPQTAKYLEEKERQSADRGGSTRRDFSTAACRETRRPPWVFCRDTRESVRSFHRS